jgi:hypothetical protein
MIFKKLQFVFIIFTFQFVTANSDSQLTSSSIFEDAPLTPSIYKGLESFQLI